MKQVIFVVAAILIIAGIYMYAQKPAQPATSEAPSEQSTGANAKIDINAVCDGALAYMSFTDGDAAAQFVAECKEGKHPEVIEKWKADMNISADAAI